MEMAALLLELSQASRARNLSNLEVGIVRLCSGRFVRGYDHRGMERLPHHDRSHGFDIELLHCVARNTITLADSQENTRGK